MMKKKLKLSISGDSKKTISSIEKAKSKSKNTVFIEKKHSKFNPNKPFVRNNFQNNRNSTSNFTIKKTNYCFGAGDTRGAPNGVGVFGIKLLPFLPFFGLPPLIRNFGKISFKSFGY